MELPKSTYSDQYGRTSSAFSAYISEYCKFNLLLLKLLFFELPAILGSMLPILGYLERGLGSSAKCEWYHWEGGTTVGAVSCLACSVTVA